MKSSDKYSKIIFKRMGIRILIFSVIFSLILAFGFAVGEYISAQIIWQPTDRLYIFLVNIRNLLPFIWAVGITGIIFFYLRKSLIYIDYIMEASNKLIANDEKYIELPADLKMLENRLNQSKKTALDNAAIAKANEERKNELIVYLAHDLKTPLTSIIGYLEILNESPDLPIEARAKYSKITLEKAYRLEELINEFFEIARFNIGKIVLNKAKLNLKLMLEQISYEFYPMAKANNQPILIDCDKTIYIYADSDKISRVFNNIIKNAISYSFADTPIKISAYITDDSDSINNNEHNNSNINEGTNYNVNDNYKVIINFENQGNTIPSEKLDYIFEKFYRLDEARSTNSGGAGLGLAIAKEIVDAHNGKISATSENNKTTFTVVLPI